MKPGSSSRLRTLGLPLIAGALSLALSACAGSVAGGTSGGKIKVDTVWGQAVAGYSELFDALPDGRVDLALALPVYQPAEFPATNAVGEALGGLPSSPHTGEMITNAVGVDVAWNTPQILQEYEDQSVYPIAPFIASGGYYSVCTKTGVSESDYPGRQVRIASKAQSGLMSRIGAAPVSMEYTEAFEAMQRGTVDCSLAQLVTAAERGLFEVAPNIGYMTDTSISRSASSLVAGKKFADSGIAGDDPAERVKAATRKWTAKAKELGYSDKGTTADFDE